MKKEVYLFRHGQTDKNLVNVWQGSRIDELLNEEGLKQAESLAKSVRFKGMTRLYCSPLMRAVQTANKISQVSAMKLPIVILQELREMNFGDAEGLTFAESRQKYGLLVDDVLFPTKETWDKRFPNGESKHEAFDRIMQCLSSIVAQEGYTFGVVCHGGLLSALSCGLELENIRFENCSVLHLAYDLKYQRFERV